jgi:hypothetical protein
MKVLIGCESSGTIRKEFRDAGHDAWSCDLLPADDGEIKYHLQCDVNKAIKNFMYWDLIILHPPCTALAVSGNAWYGKGKDKYYQRIEAIEWTTKLWELAKACCDKVCMENPVGVLPFKPTQYVQPWMFGHPESKKTGLWLHGLPKLKETNNVKKVYDILPRNQQMRLHYLPPSKDRWKIRSKTFEGIAQAIQQQWSI